MITIKYRSVPNLHLWYGYQTDRRENKVSLGSVRFMGASTLGHLP